MTTTAARPTRTEAAPSLPYLGGIDGLRAISVLAVIGYHAPLSWLPGGFLGVEVFFVISGYLITSLLVGEHKRTGSISLRSFWLRRARRLLPALYVMLAATVVMAALFADDALAAMRGDVVAALFYVSNWWQIIDGQSYFAQAGRPPLLQHLWSLAIEEQFYVLWPLAFAFFLTRVRRTSLIVGTFVVAIASTAAMAIWYDAFADDPTPLYYATFTRLGGLLAGCGLAMIWRPDRLRRRAASPKVRWVMDGVGFVGLIILVVLFTNVREFDPFVYRGAFPLTDLATLLVIMAVVHPASSMGRLIGVGPLRQIGLRSYGLYLWHFPVFQITRPGLDLDQPGWVVAATRIALTVALSEACYRLVEIPVRRGALRNLRRPPVFANGRGRWKRRSQWAMLSAAPLLVLGILVLDRSESTGAKVQREIAEASAAAADAPLLSVATSPPTVVPTTAVPVDPAAVDPIATTVPAAVDPNATTVPPAPVPPQLIPGLANTPDPPPTVPRDPSLPVTPVQVTAIGDSVMRGAAPVLQKNIPGIAINAEVSRQFGEVIPLLAGLAAFNTLGHVVLIHLGTNGVITDKMIDRLMTIVGPSRQVYFVTPKVPRPWEAEDNARLNAATTRYSNVHIIDWYTSARENPALFVSDGTHLNKFGILAYVQLVLNSLN